jgi:hypothetical protein
MVIRTVEIVVFASPGISANWVARWVAAPAVLERISSACSRRLPEPNQVELVEIGS